MRLPETDFDRERQWWDSKAPKEETDSADETINRALRWREDDSRRWGSYRRIFDVAGQTWFRGRPSGPLTSDAGHSPGKGPRRAEH